MSPAALSSHSFARSVITQLGDTALPPTSPQAAQAVASPGAGTNPATTEDLQQAVANLDVEIQTIKVSQTCGATHVKDTNVSRQSGVPQLYRFIGITIATDFNSMYHWDVGASL